MISIIIPVLNEEKALPDTLKQLLVQANDHQIIVVDGGSEDNTVKLVRDRHEIELIHSKRGRAKQMNAGAAVAKGEWLFFLHADTLIPNNALASIERLTVDKNIQAGCFHQRFSKQHWFLRFVSRLHNWRCHRTRIMYGDQAMFIRRELFELIGGFPEEDIIEDIMISETIVEHTMPVILEQEVITSSRKFEQRGLYRSLFDVCVITACHRLRLPILRQGFFAAFR